MTETGPTVTTEPVAEKPPVGVENDLSATEPRPFTGVFQDLTHGDYKAMLSDIKTEAEAALASGDATVSKWARTAGTFASLLGIFLNHTDPGEFNKLAGVVTTVVEDAGKVA